MTSTAPTKYQDFGPLSEASLPLRPAPAASQEGLAGVSFAEGLRFPETKKPQAPKSSDLYPRFSNIVFAPNPDSDFYAGDSGASRSKDTSELGLLTKVGHRLSTYLATASISLGLLGESKGGLMTDANYSNPVKHQQHLDLGKSYVGTAVHLMINGTFTGSGIVVNNNRCVLIASHEIESGGAFVDPNVSILQIITGANRNTDPGYTIRATQIIRHPSRTSPGVGTDLALLILETPIPNARPVQVATTPPAINEILTLVGAGRPATPSLGLLTRTGDLIGGYAPVNSFDSYKFSTRFSYLSSVPLIFNATPGHSGGGVFNQQGYLCGTIISGTSPVGVADTDVANLALQPNYEWIQQITALYSPNQTIPNLSISFNSGQVVLVADQQLSQSGGSWVLQCSSDLKTWNDSAATFTSGVCTMPAGGLCGFYRLAWRPTVNSSSQTMSSLTVATMPLDNTQPAIIDSSVPSVSSGSVSNTTAGAVTAVQNSNLANDPIKQSPPRLNSSSLLTFPATENFHYKKIVPGMIVNAVSIQSFARKYHSIKLVANQSILQGHTGQNVLIPNLTYEEIRGAIVLRTDAPLEQFQGQWILQSSKDRKVWIDRGVDFVRGVCKLPVSEFNRSFRINWKPYY